MEPAEAGSASADGGSRGSVAWSQPYFAALAKYLRASRGGLPRLQAHLLQARPSTAGRSTCAPPHACSLCVSTVDAAAEQLPPAPLEAVGFGGAPSFLSR